MPDLDPLIVDLRRRRKEMGLTQMRVAELAGVSLHALGGAECGRAGTTLHTLRCWARALGVELVLREPS